MVLVADENDCVVLACKLNCFEVNLCNEGTRRVDHVKVPVLGLLPDCRRNAVCAENHPSALRYFVKFFDEDSAGCPEFFDDVPVVDNFFADIDRSTEQVQCDL